MFDEVDRAVIDTFGELVTITSPNAANLQVMAFREEPILRREGEEADVEIEGNEMVLTYLKAEVSLSVLADEATVVILEDGRELIHNVTANSEGGMVKILYRIK